MSSSGTKRASRNIRMTDSLYKKIIKFSKDNSISIADAAEELVQLGLDADLCGVESSIVVQEKISRDLGDVKALFREVIRAADTASAITFTAQIQNGSVSKNQFENVFREARKFAKERMTNLKKSK